MYKETNLSLKIHKNDHYYHSYTNWTRFTIKYIVIGNLLKIYEIKLKILVKCLLQAWILIMIKVMRTIKINVLHANMRNYGYQILSQIQLLR